MPANKPPVRRFFLDDERNIWVERVTTPAQAGSIHVVFDPDGRFLGTVGLPFPLSRSSFVTAHSTALRRMIWRCSTW